MAEKSSITDSGMADFENSAQMVEDNNQIAMPFHAPYGATFPSCHDRICNLRDIFIKQIVAPCLLSVMSSKDFQLGVFVIDKFKLQL